MSTPVADLAAALRRAGITEVDASSRRRAEYSTDASLYRVLPEVVVFPRDPDEIPAIVAVSRSAGVPLTARGAGTSIAGNAVGAGIVVDFSRHLNRIHHIDADAATALVDPGVVLDDLQRAAAGHGLRFGPDPATHGRCTIGGMIGNNACGSRALGYGRTADNVVALELVTGTGQTLRTIDDPRASPTLSALRRVVGANLGVIRTEFGRFSRQVSGYSLEHLLPEAGFDVAKGFVGSEGTWGVVAAATLRLVRSPPQRALLVLGYPDMAAAADAVPDLLTHRPVALEGIGAGIVEVVRARRGPAAVPALPDGNGWLFVEFAGDEPAEVTGRARAALRAVGADDGWVVDDDATAAALWRIREDGAGLAARATDPPGLSGWEDAAVPPEHLGAYLREFDTLLAERGLTGVPYGHFGDGCLHIRIDFGLQRPGGRRVFRNFLTDAAQLVARYGGSMSGEHGDGRARGELLPLMYSPAAIGAFAAVKAVFDPDDLLNPGVIVRPRPLDADLRQGAKALPLRSRLGFGYPDDHGDFSTAVHRCTGVGKCRVADGPGVMCPSYRATRDEKDSTRGRARVLQELANGSLAGGWRAPEVPDSLDLCLSCKACSAECPTGVDMATYKAEALYQRYRHRLRPAAHYSLGWLPRWARLASVVPGAVNWLATRRFAALGKRLAGVDARRELPAFAPRTFRRWFAGHPVTDGEPLLLWVDTFTDYFTPQVGIAAVEVLEAAGYSVRIPDRRLCCGLTWISTGQLDTARKQLRRSVAALAEPALAGVPIVGLEPSCAAVFRGDAPGLLGRSAAVSAVSRSVRTLAEVLTATPGWAPPDLSGTFAVVQPHCHQHAVLGFRADTELLARAGAGTRIVDGCCGLAGNFGAERGHFDVSVAVAENDLLPAVREHPDAPVLTDGFSCRTQLDQLARRPGVHLAEMLAAALRGGAV